MIDRRYSALDVLFLRVGVYVPHGIHIRPSADSLKGFIVHPFSMAYRCEGVPLWYNKKKRRNLDFTRVCAVCRCEISPFPALKWQRKICPGMEGCYANTKNEHKQGQNGAQNSSIGAWIQSPNPAVHDAEKKRRSEKRIILLIAFFSSRNMTHDIKQPRTFKMQPEQS